MLKTAAVEDLAVPQSGKIPFAANSPNWQRLTGSSGLAAFLKRDETVTDIHDLSLQLPNKREWHPQEAVKIASIDLLPVEVRAFQDVTGPHGSAPMHAPPQPSDGQAFGGLFSAWVNEKITFGIAGSVAGMIARNEFPAGTVKWTADGFPPQNDVNANASNTAMDLYNKYAKTTSDGNLPYHRILAEAESNSFRFPFNRAGGRTSTVSLGTHEQ